MRTGSEWGVPLEAVGDHHHHHQEEDHSHSMSLDWANNTSRQHQHQHQHQINNNNNNNNTINQHHHHHDLNDTQKGWLLEPTLSLRQKKKLAMASNKYVDLGCVVCSRKALKISVLSFLVAFLVIALPIIIVKTLPKSKPHPVLPDNYTLALHKALLFFNAQKSGRLTKSNGIPWRGNSGLSDGKDVSAEVKGGLVGGYYDGGHNVKYHFPMAYTITMLSWTVIEYGNKYDTLGEYDHIRELIKWGSDYLLLTFNSSATRIHNIFCQVGGSLNGSKTPNDEYCWQRPEDMDYPRPTQTCSSGPELAAETAAALAAASIVFRDNNTYSRKLVKAAQTVFDFARDFGKRLTYSKGNLYISPYYNSSGYFDEYIWGSAWLYYATGNNTYISLATDKGIPQNAKAFENIPILSVPSWDNKLPSAMLLLTRLRIFLNPGYPYEDMLAMYHKTTTLNMCSYLQQYNVFNFTRGGLIILLDRKPLLQYAANAAFLASLYADYMDALGVRGFYCGPHFVFLDVLRNFATSQVDYILGKNPRKMSYVVGYGNKFPRHVHHRGASIPSDKKFYSCTGGFKWRDNPKPNPHNITGAMVGGPDQSDRFQDVRSRYKYTEPTLAGNAGLVAALASLTATASIGIDRNTIFSAIPPLGPHDPPPPPPWKPHD